VSFRVLSGNWRVSSTGRSIWPLTDRNASYRWTDSRTNSSADNNSERDDVRASNGERSASPAVSVGPSAQWTCSSLPPGRYEVFAWWPILRERMAGNVPYVIYHSGVSTTVRVNQAANGGTWNSLGVYDFDSTGVRVVIGNSRTTWWDTRVVADAIKIVAAP